MLGPSDRKRLEGLLGLAVTEQFPLSDCLAALFPGLDSREAQTAFTSFLKRLNDAAQGEGRAELALRFHMDSNEQRPPDERFCWFTGPALARQEYVLAAQLTRALVEGQVERWNLPGVPPGTLDFLGQLLPLESQQATALRALEMILGGDQLQAAVLAFAYWLRALVQGFPAPTPARVNLSGANLEEWHLRGRGPTQPLNLRNANLSQVRLNRARLEDVDLAGANLSGLAARQALCLKVSAPQAFARNADVRGLKWREGRLEGADFTGAQVAGSQWLHVGLEGATLPEGWERLASVVKEPLGGLPSQKGAPVPAVFLGHSYGVNACAWSPDGQRLLSGGWDGTLKVWDASTGQCSRSGQLLPEGQWASIDEAHGRILHASPEAWRWLGWRWTEPSTGRLRILPAESFGPLPS